ncbi:MAG: galactose mutarotase [Ruminococcus sp.]|nr:galactose mutarotase [Ruminococcus sp.]
MSILSSEPFGAAKDGAAVTRYTLRNDNGMQVCVLGYGCAVQSILVPDHSGNLQDVALGYDTIEDYENGICFFGAFVGRYANRIQNAAFSLNGKTYRLEQNDGKNHLHGKLAKRVYNGVIENDSLVFHIISPPEEEGFPGTLSVRLLYRLTNDNALEIEYEARTDEDTVINLTNHTYFNLNGHDGSDVLGHLMRINADRFTEINEQKLPTGRIPKIGGTPLDFRQEKQIGADLFSDDPQLRYACGYDHNLILGKTPGEFKAFALIKSEKTGIVLSASTTEPAVQLYTGNFIQEDPVPHGKSGIRYPRFGGFCLEAQHYPCSPNFPDFPTTVLKKGEVYRQKTVYRFSF